MRLRDLKTDFQFIRSHTLQPAWYKVLKLFILAGLVAGYLLVLGPLKTVVWFAIFIAFTAALHFVYRAKTKAFTKSWMDFRVIEEDGKRRYGRIGALYYSVVLAAFAAATLIAVLV